MCSSLLCTYSVLSFLGCFHNQSLVDVWDNTTTSNGSFNQGVQLFVTSDGKLQVSWSDSLYLQVLWGVTSKLQNFSSQILKNGSAVYSWGSSNSAVGTNSALQKSMNSSDRELHDSNKLTLFITKKCSFILTIDNHSGFLNQNIVAWPSKTSQKLLPCGGPKE